MQAIHLLVRRLAARFTSLLGGRPRSKTPLREPVIAPKRGLRFEHHDPEADEYRAVAGHIANLMLADEWVEIAENIAEWERELVSTPGGLRYHEIAVEVALSGLRSLLDTARRESLADLDDAEYELRCFIDTYQRSPEMHVLALLAARAHLMVGKACRGEHWPAATRSEAWRHMARHFVAARDILVDYDARALMSPLVAEAQYLQAIGSPAGQDRVPDLFEAWITLDPSNPRTYAIHAEWLARPDNASQQTILSMADDALERTEDTLGCGGYALFFQPLLSLGEDTRSLYDPELFATAVFDLATHSASQADVNRAADILANEIHTCAPNAPLALKDTLLMLVQNEIRVCYPSLWSLPEDLIRSLFDEAAEIVPDIYVQDLPRAA